MHLFPILDGPGNPPPSSQIYAAGGPVNPDSGSATLAFTDGPMIPLPPNLATLIAVDITHAFNCYLVWGFDDGSIWTLAVLPWQARFHAQVDGGQLVIGSNASVTNGTMALQHVDPVVRAPVANSAGWHWE